MLKTFIKRYGRHDFQYATSVRHDGKVIAFALALEDQTRRPIILYTVLDLKLENDQAGQGGRPASPLDVDAWSPSPLLLPFPDEIAEVGYGVADQTKLPLYKQGQQQPERPGTVVASSERDEFQSTTARLTAPQPFHVLSDGKHVYLFRQAVAASHAPAKLDREGNAVTDAAGNPVPLVDSTLLVDRFALVGASLVNKREVRFQRSRSKTRPQSRKDGLGDKDLDGRPFIEPTQELTFVSRLTDGRFTALLIPTLVAGIQRWQLFAQNTVTGLIDAYSVERAADGLFNLKGTQFYTSPDPRHQKDVFEAKPGIDPFTGEELVPFVETTGHAESALVFAGGSHVDLGAGIAPGARFTLEAWILPTRPDGIAPQALIGGSAGAEASRSDPTAAPSIRIDRMTRLRIGFGDGTRWREHTTRSLLALDDWNHVAVSFDGMALRVFINGRLRDKAEATAAYVGGALQTLDHGDDAGAPALVALEGSAPASSPITTIGAQQGSFHGTIDEVRLWHRPRAAHELRGDMSQRLTGREFGLAAYWRFDEARGDTIFDQTDQRINGTIHGCRWDTSDAPIGDSTGLARSSFAIATSDDDQLDQRSFASGITAILYYQQAEVRSGYDTSQKKRLKQNARVMLAVATRAAAGTKNEIAAVDLGVAATGTLAEIPDLLRLEVIQKTDDQGRSINQRLDQLGDLEGRAQRLDEEIFDLGRAIDGLRPVVATLGAALADPPVINAAIGHDEHRYLNPQLSAYRDALAAVGTAQAEVGRVHAERDAARVRLFEHASFVGRSQEYGLGPISHGELAEDGLDEVISSIQIAGPLEVKAFEHADRGGRSRSFALTTAWVGEDFNDVISSVDIGETAAFTARRVAAEEAQRTALGTADEWRRKLAAAHSGLQTRLAQLAADKGAKEVELQTLRTTLAELGNELRHGVELTMPQVAIDRRGLTISGAVLGFAWTTDTPRLFDSATGSLALYFRGERDQFFVTYYTTLTQRARYPLQGVEDSNQVAVCEARAADLEMDRLKILIGDGADADHCTVTIAGADVEEVWSAVPRAAPMFARVLNGTSSLRELVGRGILGRIDGRVRSLKLAQGVRRAIPKGHTLVVGRSRVMATRAAAKGALSVEVTGDTEIGAGEELPVYYLEYDYDRHTRTTKVPNDLYNGSLLVRVASEPNGTIKNQRVVSGTTLNSKWIAESPGSMLAFDGNKAAAHLTDTAAINSFDAAADLTLEAWLKPAFVDQRARVLQHRSASSSYTLGLEQVRSGLLFDGQQDHVDLGDVLNPEDSAWTIELWFRCDRTEGWNILYNKETLYEAAVRDGHFQYAWQPHWQWVGDTSFPVTAGVWYHAAVVYDRGTQIVYRNGQQVFARAQAGSIGSNTAKLLIAARGDTAPHHHFKGAIGELRIWQRARSAQEIAGNLDTRLQGGESDLIGYWRHLDPRGGTTTDLTSSQNHGQVQGSPQPATDYRVFAGVNDRYARCRQLLQTGSWTHLAAVYHQSYALGFDGSDAHLDCGADTTLNLNGDLTLELTVFDGGGTSRGLLAKGAPGAAAGHMPYALFLDGSGKIRFQFEDDDGNTRDFVSDAAIGTTRSYRIAVTRKRESAAFSLGGAAFYSFDWHEIAFYVDGAPSGRRYYAVGYEGLVDRARGLAGYSDPNDIPGPDKVQFLGAAAGRTTFTSPPIGRNAAALEIGRAHLGAGRPIPYRGTIGEARIWSRALEAAETGGPSTAKLEGLVSWWRFEERQGTIATDDAGNNHGTINGAVTWVKDPSAGSSSLVIYQDGVPCACDDISAVAGPLGAATPQFTLGALQVAGGFGEHLEGEMEELRVWQSMRTQEQIQDNLFRRLTGEHEQLIAYYSFDAIERNQLTDQSNRGNHLELAGTSYILSSAPIGVDTPQVRSALAGVRTAFHGTVHGQPGVAEYGDIQYDSAGNLIGTFKRCYSIIQPGEASDSKGEWHLITGFKVGDLVTEWIGQVQFAPQLLGYIEGAPPVPSENLAATGYVLGEFADYVGASSVTFRQAETINYTYAANQETSVDLSIDTKFGGVAGAKLSAGLFLYTETVDVESFAGLHASFETSWGWLAQSETSVGRTSTQDLSMGLRGSVENANAIVYPAIGRRFVPDNVGMAFVLSETADLFALRLKHNQALVSFQMRPNPDIPQDRNIITFPINPRYTRQGTLDGKVGLDVDPNYPNALSYSADVGYFKPREAYRLKAKVERDTAERRERYQQYDAGGIGRGGAAGPVLEERLRNPSAAEHRRNLVNSYVWTADGGLFAESEETMSSHSETLGGSFDFTGKAGLSLDLGFEIVGLGVKFELDLLLGGSVHRTVSKSASTEQGFALDVDLSGVESDVYLRNVRGELVMDLSDPRNPAPERQPGRVDAYRFMSFYLEPETEHFETFFNKVVDPIWLESDEPNAAALREARGESRKPPCWRILHRVTYVSRVLPSLDEAAPASLEKSLQSLDIDSNYQLIRQLDPFVRDKLSSEVDFARAVEDAVTTYLPELQPHLPEIKQYLRLYFGIAHDAPDHAEDDVFGQATLAERALNQPPIVDAGPDQIVGMAGAQVTVALDGNAIDDRFERADEIFVSWSSDGEASFADPHALATSVQFRARGRYALQLTGDDGSLSDSDEVVVTVNQPPSVSAGTDQELRPASGAGLLAALASDDPARSFLEQQLAIDSARSATRLDGRIIDDGLGDPVVGRVALKWTKVSGVGEVVFFEDDASATVVSFSHSGHYLLRLSADNGSFSTNAEVTVAVAARVTLQLQALYTFEEREGRVVHDVTGMAEPLDLEIADPQAVRWDQGGLTLQAPTVVRSPLPAERLTRLLQATGALTIEAWVTPASAVHAGLGRIVTLSAGARERNVTLGQAGDGFHVGLRTTRTNPNASDRALTAAASAGDRLTHVVCSYEASGVTRLYVDGRQVALRLVGGALTNWAKDVPLALGNEPAADPAAGRGADRAWLGTLHLVAIYSRALSLDEIAQNYLFGADADLPPVISAGPDVVVDAPTLPASIELNGTVTHDRPTPGMQVLWSRVSGPGEEVSFDDESALVTRAALPQHGRYVLRLSVSDASGTSSETLQALVNTAPVVAAGGSAHVSLPERLALEGRVLDSGLGEPDQGRLGASWRKTGGPGRVTFDDPHALATTASFSAHGAYALALDAGNGRLDASDTLAVYVHERPSIDAAAPPLVTLGSDGTARVPLTAELRESGLGDPNGAVTVRWIVVQAPGPVTFEPSSETLAATAVMTRSGPYSLALTVDNGHLSSRREITLVVNQAPTVHAGPPQTVVMPAEAVLDATIGDDGLPLDPGKVRVRWQQLSGPEGVKFTDPAADYTRAVLPGEGLYVLQVNADDGAASASATTTVEVVRPPRVATGLLALYRFAPDDDTIIHDRSGAASPLDLAPDDPQAVSRTDQGLTLLRPTTIRSAAPAGPLIAAIKASQAFTIEARITPDATSPIEETPARIVTISADHGHRNTTLGQDKRGFSARVRTSDRRPDDLNGVAHDLAFQRRLPSGPIHLVYVCDLAGGKAQLYADDVAVAHRSLSGDASSWDDAYHLALGNELNGERAWLGTYHLVAVYDRALTVEEVEQNFYAGPAQR